MFFYLASWEASPFQAAVRTPLQSLARVSGEKDGKRRRLCLKLRFLREKEGLQLLEQWLPSVRLGSTYLEPSQQKLEQRWVPGPTGGGSDSGLGLCLFTRFLGDPCVHPGLNLLLHFSLVPQILTECLLVSGCEWDEIFARVELRFWMER